MQWLGWLNNKTAPFAVKTTYIVVSIRVPLTYGQGLAPTLSQIKKARINRTFVFGGDKGGRTPDLRIANATLYQLSYIPNGVLYTLIFAICQVKNMSAGKFL